MAESYNYDMQRLQQDAIRRAREMQARARNFPPQAPPPASPPKKSVPEPPAQARHIPPAEPRHAPPREPLGHGQPQKPIGPIENIFEGLMKDSERTLILVLILLLAEEKTNSELIFALMYLII